jgi:protein TonB
VDGGTVAADPAPPATGGGDIAPAGSGPAVGMRLAYARASAPPYPSAELRAGHQGTVTLRVLVDVDGRPLQVDVETGSGYRRLDEAARRHVLRNWTFQPAMRDGHAVQAIGLVPIEFTLERG